MGTSCRSYREREETTKLSALPECLVIWPTRLDLAKLLSPVPRRRRSSKCLSKGTQLMMCRPIRPENASALAAASNPGEGTASGEAEFD
jgi:hypothetical protein